MEYIDIYDEEGIFLGKEDRKIVHRDALWHKTVHCWLYDSSGNVIFQIREDLGKFYTTASGHVAAGETLTEAFGREIFEEIGIKLDYEKARLIDVVKFIMDRENNDGTLFRDRAFANVFGYEYNKFESFKLDSKEVIGLVKVNAKDALELFKSEHGQIDAEFIDIENNITKRKATFNDFLVNKGETAIGKYGNILEKIIEFTSKKEN